jgi:hypothetical protein
MHRQKILEIRRTTAAVFLTLECGHMTSVNPTFAYKEGAEVKCFRCEHAGDYRMLAWAERLLAEDLTASEKEL